MMVDVKILEARKALAEKGIELKNSTVLDANGKGLLKEYILKEWKIKL